LFNANSDILQPYHGENRLTFNVRATNPVPRIVVTLWLECISSENRTNINRIPCFSRFERKYIKYVPGYLRFQDSSIRNRPRLDDQKPYIQLMTGFFIYVTQGMTHASYSLI